MSTNLKGLLEILRRHNFSLEEKTDILTDSKEHQVKWLTMYEKSLMYRLTEHRIAVSELIQSVVKELKNLFKKD